MLKNKTVEKMLRDKYKSLTNTENRMRAVFQIIIHWKLLEEKCR